MRKELNLRRSSFYSNWNAANVDPDELKRHKELLDRQHFKGPFWEGKMKPKSVEEEPPQVDLGSYVSQEEYDQSLKDLDIDRAQSEDGEFKEAR